MLGKFQPQQPVHYLQLWNEAISRGSDGALFHFYLTWMLPLTPLLPRIWVFKERSRFRCLRATWTTARTPIMPGWRKPSSTSTWTEKIWSQTSKTWCVSIDSFHWCFSQQNPPSGSLISCYSTPQVASKTNNLKWQELSGKSSLMTDHQDSLRRVAEKHSRKFWCLLLLLFFILFFFLWPLILLLSKTRERRRGPF